MCPVSTRGEEIYHQVTKPTKDTQKFEVRSAKFEGALTTYPDYRLPFTAHYLLLTYSLLSSQTSPQDNQRHVVLQHRLATKILDRGLQCVEYLLGT